MKETPKDAPKDGAKQIDPQAESRKKMEESLAKQRESIRKQPGVKLSDGFFTLEWATPPNFPAPPQDCDALGQTESDALIAGAATAQKVDPALLRAVIQQESGFKPCVQSAKGAMGMMQLMPDTAARFKVADPFNAEANVQAGAQYLKELLDRFKGDIPLTLAAYNAGPERVDGDPPAVPDIAETQDYVKAILKALGK